MARSTARTAPVHFRFSVLCADTQCHAGSASRLAVSLGRKNDQNFAKDDGAPIKGGKLALWVVPCALCRRWFCIGMLLHDSARVFYAAFNVGFILTPCGYWPQQGMRKGITSATLKGPTNGPVAEGERVGVGMI
jgi:hypothetical protein